MRAVDNWIEIRSVNDRYVSMSSEDYCVPTEKEKSISERDRH